MSQTTDKNNESKKQEIKSSLNTWIQLRSGNLDDAKEFERLIIKKDENSR